MNPSVLAQQLQQAVSDYLRVSFETTTPFFEAMLERFIATPGPLGQRARIFRSNCRLRRALERLLFPRCAVEISAA
jgi:hypothetical protein